MQVPPSRSNHSPKVPPPNTIALKIKISTYKILGGNKIQSITGEEVYLNRPCDCDSQDLYPHL